jgi:hypothetical protein
MWSVSQTGSRTWSQASCLGTHSYWLHPNLSKVVRQTWGLGTHLKNKNAAHEPLNEAQEATKKARDTGAYAE